jgi:hypothetical protein
MERNDRRIEGRFLNMRNMEPSAKTPRTASLTHHVSHDIRYDGDSETGSGMCSHQAGPRQLQDTSSGETRHFSCFFHMLATGFLAEKYL